jgi:hypothetical protein
VDRVITCSADPSMDHNSDYLPITTRLALRIIQRPKVDRHDWSSIDEKEFRIRFARELLPLRGPRTKTALDRYTGEVVAAIQGAINHFHVTEKMVPKSKSLLDHRM